MKKMKKVLSVFLALTMATSTFMAHAASPATTPTKNDPYVVFYGDLNGDNKITMKDCTKLVLSNLHLARLTDKQKRAADVNVDGKRNIKDVFEVACVAMGWKLGVSADKGSWITADTPFALLDRNNTMEYRTSIVLPNGVKIRETEQEFKGGKVAISPSGVDLNFTVPKTLLLANLTASNAMDLKFRIVLEGADKNKINTSLNTELGMSDYTVALKGTFTGAKYNNLSVPVGLVGLTGKAVLGTNNALSVKIMDQNYLNVRATESDLQWVWDLLVESLQNSDMDPEEQKVFFESIGKIKSAYSDLQAKLGESGIVIETKDLYSLAVSVSLQALKLLPIIADIQVAPVNVGGVEYTCERYTVLSEDSPCVDTFYTPNGNLCRVELNWPSHWANSDLENLVFNVYDREPMEATDGLFALPEGEYMTVKEFILSCNPDVNQ